MENHPIAIASFTAIFYFKKLNTAFIIFDGAVPGFIFCFFQGLQPIEAKRQALARLFALLLIYATTLQ
jgi:hypothetical protein